MKNLYSVLFLLVLFSVIACSNSDINYFNEDDLDDRFFVLEDFLFSNLTMEFETDSTSYSQILDVFDDSFFDIIDSVNFVYKIGVKEKDRQVILVHNDFEELKSSLEFKGNPFVTYSNKSHYSLVRKDWRTIRKIDGEKYFGGNYSNFLYEADGITLSIEVLFL